MFVCCYLFSCLLFFFFFLVFGFFWRTLHVYAITPIVSPSTCERTLPLPDFNFRINIEHQQDLRRATDHLLYIRASVDSVNKLNELFNWIYLLQIEPRHLCFFRPIIFMNLMLFSSVFRIVDCIIITEMSTLTSLPRSLNKSDLQLEK